VSEPDLVFERNFLPASESERLYAALVEGVAWDERMKSRKTACFGQAYDYSGMTYDTVPMHPLLVPLVDRLEARLGYRPNNCLLNLYEGGEAVMGFHSDSEAEIVPGTGVAIISLGAERGITFRGKRGTDKGAEHTYPLPAGSLLYMPPGVQQDWRHGILKQEGAGGRISLTFRRLKEA
jgi:alkylated DNA repair dioxygenase AlkB